MEKIKQIKLIEQPREDIKLSAQDESSLFGGFYCPGTFKDGGMFGTDICTYHHGTGVCGGQDDYCGTYSNCTFHLG